MVEVILNELGGGKFLANSAGSHPTGVINPAAIAKLSDCGHQTGGLRSKSWDEFERSDAPAFDYVITVCNNAANETCPVWIGSPVCAHWGIPDPAAVEGGDEAIRQAFDVAYERLAKRIGALLALPLASMGDEAIPGALAGIGSSHNNDKIE